MTLSALGNRRPTAVVTLDDVLADIHRTTDVPREAAAALLAEVAARQAHLAAVQTALTARLQTEAGTGQQDDRLLSIDEAANILSVNKDWLYRHARVLPFTVRHGHQVRFSAHGIQTYIRQRRGRA